MSDAPDGHASAAAQEADAVDDVTRNTKSQTTAASYTTDHEVIRAWAEARGGCPATVSGTEGSGGSGGGVLRIEFDRSSDQLAEADWDEFFSVFDDRKLAFVYQEQTSDGRTSRFSKLVSRDGG